MKAIWNKQVVAESNDTVVVESNHYFPMCSINREFFQKSGTQTTCFWKGKASYFNIVVDGEVNADAAWYYPEVKKNAKAIEGMVAFWRGVEVSD